MVEQTERNCCEGNIKGWEEANGRRIKKETLPESRSPQQGEAMPRSHQKMFLCLELIWFNWSSLDILVNEDYWVEKYYMKLALKTMKLVAIDWKIMKLASKTIKLVAKMLGKTAEFKKDEAVVFRHTAFRVSIWC